MLKEITKDIAHKDQEALLTGLVGKERLMKFMKIAPYLVAGFLVLLYPVTIKAAMDIDEMKSINSNEETIAEAIVEEVSDYAIMKFDKALDDIENRASVSKNIVSDDSAIIISINDMSSSISDNEEVIVVSSDEAHDDLEYSEDTKEEKPKTKETKPKKDKKEETKIEPVAAGIENTLPAVDTTEEINIEPSPEPVVAQEVTVDQEVLEENTFDQIGYADNNTVDVLDETYHDSDVVATINYQEEIKYDQINEYWAAVEVEGRDEVGYIPMDNISETQVSSSYKAINGDKRKSYENYRKISAGKQKSLQQLASTASDGGRVIGDRYLIACGTGVSGKVGQYLDVVLANGHVIPCIVGDVKADQHTTNNHTVGMDGSAIEFIVDTTKLSTQSKRHGNMDYAKSEWNSRAQGVILYDSSI